MRHGPRPPGHIMRFTSIPAAFLTLTLLVVIPAGGAPALQVGSSATYNLSISISFPPLYCDTSPTSSLPTIVYCPMIAMMPPTFDVNGTVSWTVAALNSTTAVLNVTSDLATSPWDSLTVASFRSSRSFNESVDLSTRIVSIMPFLTTEIDQALQTAQTSLSATLPTNPAWNSSTNIIDSALKDRHPIHTMWWVNGPLQLNQTVPILVFPTNVTGSTGINLGSIGTRNSWILSYNLTLPRPQPEQDTPGTYNIPSGDNLQAAFTFNYDQGSDLLLSATADIYLGFFQQLSYQTSQCPPPSTITCVSPSSFMPMQNGVSIQASLTIASTNLNLDQRVSPTTPSAADTGSNSGSNSETTTGTGGASTGNSQSSGSNPGSTPEAASSKPSTSGIPWIYWILGIAAIVIIATSLWIARKRANKTSARSASNSSHS